MKKKSPSDEAIEHAAKHMADFINARINDELFASATGRTSNGGAFPPYAMCKGGTHYFEMNSSVCRCGALKK